MPTGLATTYDLTVGVPVDMDEAIWMLSPDDLPLLTGLGADGLTLIGTQPVDEREFSWMDESLLVPRSNVALAVVTADTVLTLKTGDRTKFSTFDTIRIAKSAGAGSGETIRITSYGVTAETIIVTRAFRRGHHLRVGRHRRRARHGAARGFGPPGRPYRRPGREHERHADFRADRGAYVRH